ncbi:MAG: hypothetical protein C7K11_03755 [Candidatus Amulumruptor caecigallinarius]|uniref:Uncharacterized protein n=1 Tax=Candidatus Amulumruptor caecigallinarius TaxID=2109911 RepID=A0A4Q0U9J9_9BACT|nr:MAG: hypothetical protein C7K11_03755 [Candidatus Amulumruptor caecigallinarius]HJE39730.1 hypothetical protein [Candidatus Amulumruptor caecigallinarius]
MMKSLIYKLLAVFVAVMAVSCSSGPSIEELVAEVNKHMPVRVPGVGQVKSIDFADNTLTYQCLVLNKSFNLKALEGHEDEMKAAMSPMLPNLLNYGKNRVFTEKLIEEEASIAIHYFTKGPKAADVTVTYSPAELKDIVDGKVDDSPEAILKTQITVNKLQTPMRIDSETTLTDIEGKDGYMVYTFEMDETRAPGIIDNLNEGMEELRKNNAETLRSNAKDIRQTVDACKAANYGIIYRYVGVPSGKVAEVKFEASEL